MNEQELRTLVRQVVAERLGARPMTDGGASPIADARPHPSHGVLRMAPSVEAGQPCIIEPHVGCSQCGFCRSYGH